MRSSLCPGRGQRNCKCKCNSRSPAGMTTIKAKTTTRTKARTATADTASGADASAFDLFCSDGYWESVADDRGYLCTEEFDGVEKFVVVQGGYAHLETDAGDAAESFVHLQEF
jgi:hypothetical protein